MKIYKLVRRRSDDKLYSYNSTESERIGLSKRRYIPNEWTEAHPKMLELGLGLAGFKTLQDAVDYDCPNTSENKLEIWECDAVGLKGIKPSKWLQMGSFVSIKVFKKSLNVNEIRSFGNKLMINHLLKGSLNLWPKGTILVQKVKPLKRIK